MQFNQLNKTTDLNNNSSAKLFFQPKLTINQPNDMYEQEADAVADKVMRTMEAPVSTNDNKSFFSPPTIQQNNPATANEELLKKENKEEESEESLPEAQPVLSFDALPTPPDDNKTNNEQSIQRTCNHCDEEEKKKLQRKEAGGNEAVADSSTENYISSLSGKGRTLSQQERRFFEPRMGYDFSRVQLHTNTEANQSAKSINALAYTHGDNIVFGANQYQPNTSEGKKLMAHELTHVVQQEKHSDNHTVNRFTGDDLTPITVSATGFSEAAKQFISDFSEIGESAIKILEDARIMVTVGKQMHVYDGKGNELTTTRIVSLKTIIHLPNGVYTSQAEGTGTGKKIIFYRLMVDDEGHVDIIRGVNNTKEKKGADEMLDDMLSKADADYLQHDLLGAVNNWFLIIPGAGNAKGSSLDTPAWATKLVDNVNKAMKGGEGTGNSKNGAKKDLSKTPDRLVVWSREDGKQFVNVWVGGNNTKDGGVSESVELQEGEDIDQLQQRIEDATAKAREKLTQKAVDEENKVTGNNLPYSDSTYLGGTDTDGTRPNMPAYRADIKGPETTVRNATSNYSMHLHYEDVSPILINQVWEAFTGANYVWQIIDITSLQDQIRKERAAQIALQQAEIALNITPTLDSTTPGQKQQDDLKQDKLSQHTTVGRTDAVGRDFTRTMGNIDEDATNAAYDLTHPLSSQDGSSEAAVRSVLVNSFNLNTLPLHAIMSLGGWLIRSFAAIFRPHDDDDRDIPFPDREGTFLIRCVAQPRIHGDADEKYELRMPSVAVLVVQVKDIQTQTRQEMEAQDQNLQAGILELITAYQNTKDATQLQKMQGILKLKVQEAAQTNSGFLKEQIDKLGKLLDTNQPQQNPLPDDQRKRVEEILAILKEGTQTGSGVISLILEQQIALKEKELEDAQKYKPTDVSRLEKELDTLRSRFSTAIAREAEMYDSSKVQPIRPNAVFVNEADGQTVPLLIEIGQIGGRHTTRGYTMRVSDITSKDGDEYNAIGDTQAQAIKNVLKEYSNHFPYGRGTMNVRLPENQNYGIGEMLSYRCAPHDTQQASERLDELIQLLAILGLFVPGVGTVAMVAGAAISVARLLHRVSNHTFEWDMNAIMDVLNILAAVASGVSAVANAKLIRTSKMFAFVEGSEEEIAAWTKELESIATVAEAAKFAEKAINKLSYFLGTMQTVEAYLEVQKQEILGNITHSEARRQRAQIIAQGMYDQFMQHAPDIVEAVKERNQSHENPTPADDETTKHHDQEPVPHDKGNTPPPKAPPDEQQHTPPSEPTPGHETGSTPHNVHTEPVAPTPEQRVKAFFANRDNVRGILKGDMAITRKLLETHGNWRDLIMHLESEPGNDIYGVAIDNLQQLRESIVANLGENFGLHLSAPNASTTAGSDVDLATTGPDAGDRLLHAEEFMRARYGDNWSEKLRMNFYTEAERLFIYEQVRSLMSDADFGALQQQITTLAETLNFAKMLQHAGSDAESIARVEGLMAYLPEAQRAEIKQRAVETPADSQKIVADLHRQIDTLMAKFQALPPDDTARVALAREITRLQMEANFRTTEANISPGANRQVVRGVAVRGYEAYQSALSQLEMMEHILHTTGGNIETAVREYELYKYIGRFIEAMSTAGLPMDATMLAYYQASFDIYKNSRTQLQGVNRHDLSWLTAYHAQFMKAVIDVLPKLKQAGADNAADWNPTHDSLQVPQTTTTVPSPTPGDTKQIKTPTGIGDKRDIQQQQTDEGTITDADIDKSFKATFDAPPPAATDKPVEGKRTDRSTPGETYFVTDDASPRFSVRAYIERGHLRIDMRTVLEDGTRSSVLNGSTEFVNILKFFEGKFDGILTNWQYGTNLGKVNELTGKGMSLDEAVRLTWSGQKAIENGLTQVRIFEQSGTPGNYSLVKVLFAHP